MLTQYYDDALRPVNMRITQYALLSDINTHPGRSIGELAEAMGMDQTTVTRNVELLAKSGYIVINHDTGDLRKRNLSLTDSGKIKLSQVEPLWKKAQADVEKKLGVERYRQLADLLAELSSIL